MSFKSSSWKFNVKAPPSLIKNISPAKLSFEETLNEGEDISESAKEITAKEKELTMGQKTGIGWDKDAKTNVEEQGGAVDKPGGGVY